MSDGVVARDAVRLAALRDGPLSIDEVVDAVRERGAGGLVVFVGMVRDHDGGRSVERLDYEAHPTAEQRLHDVAAAVAARHTEAVVGVTHRTGSLAIGDIAVVAAAACPHRGEAFDAARALIDELKATVPIWKHQIFVDGEEEWVGTP